MNHNKDIKKEDVNSKKSDDPSEQREKGDHEQGHEEHGQKHPGKNAGHDDHTRHEHMNHQTDHGHEGHAHEHDHKSHHARMAQDFKKRFWVSLILTAPILFLSPMIQAFLGLRQALEFGGSNYILFVFATAVFFYGGYPFLKGLFNEIKSARPGMMTLIALAISVAYFYSSAVVFGLSGRLFYWELATLIDVMLLGHWIEMKSVMGASKALETLAQLLPSTAHKVADSGDTQDVPISDLKSSDRVLVKPGEKIPADGIIEEGESSVNEAAVTGESKPVAKKPGDEVIGGSINAEGSLKIEVQNTGENSFVSRVIQMVKKAQQSKSKAQGLADRAALWLTIIAISSGALTLILWLTLSGKDFVFALTRTVTVMVITCPHALGLAIPLVIAVSTALAASNGLLIRNRIAFESARKIQTVVFDKTGTLTKGEFAVREVVPISEDFSKDDVIKYAASLEANSEHSIARGIVKAAESKYEVKSFNAIPGKGAEGKIEGKEVKIVSPGFLKEKGIEIKDNQTIEGFEDKGWTTVFLLIENEPKGVIALADQVRDESKHAIEKLKSLGIKSMMLTGDNERAAKSVADELGLDDYFAEVLPDDKIDRIKKLQSSKTVVAMVGDGVNDAPALAQADVGIAIGAGTDVAAETADVILVKNNPMDVVAVVNLAKASYKKTVQNLLWATGYNAVAIPLAAGVLYTYGILLSPAVGAILMSLSTVIVAINAKLLKM